MPAIRLPFRISAIEDLAVPAVSILISFLAYTSQFLFYHIEPGPLSQKEALWFNVCVAAIWWSYYNACTTDPGRKGWVERFAMKSGEKDGGELHLEKGTRWCKKCEAVKPPRAHHCKKCKRYDQALHSQIVLLRINRCIPKMDHHCPWTSNCVSYTTFPHFMRFVFYDVISMSILAYHLYARVMVVWDNRKLPAYLGPSLWALSHLVILCVVNGLTLFALSLMFIQTTHSLMTNTTMIEGWEIDRHAALVGRARKQGGYVYANGGQRVRIERQEFPYDVGWFKNLCHGMGTSNPLLWLLPFASGPRVERAGNWEVNGFEDEDKVWPPLDPDKMTRRERGIDEPEPREYGTVDEEREAFRRRQERDHQRWKKSDTTDCSSEEDSEFEVDEGIDGEPGWTNSDGDRLRDYGVDEEAEVFSDDDDIPLAELIRRRKARPFE